jgi:putative membrane protein
MKKMHSMALAVAALSVAQFAGAAELGKKDTRYMSETAQGLISEVKLGEMAQKQAADERVKEFGKRMVADHGKDLENLKQLASKKNVTLPDAANAEQRKEADKLAKLSGAAFDKEYVKYEMKDHKHDVKEQGEEMKQTADPDLKKFASAAHQTVSGHKQIVDDLHAKLGN